jgi:hypothetical protein
MEGMQPRHVRNFRFFHETRPHAPSEIFSNLMLLRHSKKAMAVFSHLVVCEK